MGKLYLFYQWCLDMGGSGRRQWESRQRDVRWGRSEIIIIIIIIIIKVRSPCPRLYIVSAAVAINTTVPV